MMARPRPKAFTIQPGKQGEVATVIARVNGTRICANSSDPGVARELRSGPVAGRKVRIESGAGGVNSVWLV